MGSGISGQTSSGFSGFAVLSIFLGSFLGI